MSQVNYKSTRLLVEAINKAMEGARKAAMGNMALGELNELRDLVALLAKKAERVALEDLTSMAETDPAGYVAAMMPFVAEYHRQLAPRDLLAPCLCRDLRVPACVVIIVGDQGSRVRVAHDPNRPDVALIVETLLASLDEGTKKVAADAAAIAENSKSPDDGVAPRVHDCAVGACDCFAGIDRQVGESLPTEGSPLTLEMIEAALGVDDDVVSSDDVQEDERSP